MIKKCHKLSITCIYHPSKTPNLVLRSNYVHKLVKFNITRNKKRQHFYQARFETAFVNAPKTSLAYQISLPKVLSGQSKVFEGEATSSIALRGVVSVLALCPRGTSLLHTHFKNRTTETVRQCINQSRSNTSLNKETIQNYKKTMAKF